MRTFTALAFNGLLYAAGTLALAATSPQHLQVEQRVEPLGVDANHPRFSWWTTTTGAARGVEQQAYELVVRDPAGGLAWDSGRVADGRAIEIAYAGAPLRPETRYAWSVTAWYGNGESASASSWFETGLMDTGIGAWEGATWVGGTAGDRPLYAPYLPLYDLACTLQISAGSTRAALVFAANDARLMDARRNPYQLAAARGGSYFKVELDVAPLAQGGGSHALLKVYRAGYARGDDPAQPVRTLAVRRELIDAGTAHAAHRIGVHAEYGELWLQVDGRDDAFEPEPAQADATASMPGSRAGPSVQLNPARPQGTAGHDVITFGQLNQIGFAMEPGQRARFSGLVVSDIRTPKNELFNDKPATGAHHGLFGLPVVDGAYDVDGGAGGLFRVADPSRNAMPMLRTTFSAGRARLVSARLYATARGIYELQLNGQRVGDDHYSPGLSQYNRTHYYQAYDVTSLVRPGGNALGAMLGEGWWSGLLSYGNNWNFFGDRQSLLAKLVLTYADGSRQVVTTRPDTWKAFAHGPIVYSSLDLGEVYDATREAAIKGWSSAGYDDRSWHAAVDVPLQGTAFLGTVTAPFATPETFDYASLRLVAQVGEPARVYQALAARSVREVRKGVFVYDMGQNIVGVPRIALHAARPGQRIVLRVAETLYPDLPESGGNVGMVMTENYRAATSSDQYVTRAGDQVIEPRFTSHGFQYLEITGLPHALPLAQVQALAISSVQRLTASYESSDRDLNRLWSNLTWSNVDNFLTIPTDCPQRNERMGWSGDISVFSRTATYLSDAQGFLERHMRAMRDVQKASGKFTDIAPVGGGFGGVLWGSAGITVPWELYQQYGDVELLREHYPAMVAYVDYLQATLDPASGLSRDAQLGDWLGPQNQQLGQPYLATAYHAYDLGIVAQVARLLGNDADAARFEGLYRQRLEFFRSHFLAADGRSIGYIGKSAIAFGPAALEGDYRPADTQTSYAVALGLGLVDAPRMAAVRAHLAASVERANRDDGGVERPPYALMTGFIGTAWISQALSEGGRTDLAYRQLLGRQYPS
ncbi:MAG: hypothetical protein RL684_819, partial [Pseudomonadota bacterium]